MEKLECSQISKFLCFKMIWSSSFEKIRSPISKITFLYFVRRKWCVAVYKIRGTSWCQHLYWYYRSYARVKSTLNSRSFRPTFFEFVEPIVRPVAFDCPKNPESRVKNSLPYVTKVSQKSKILKMSNFVNKKIEICKNLTTNRNAKIFDFFNKKLKFWLKIEILTKNWNFD